MNLRNLLVFGTGVGIELGEKDLEIVVARVRPSGTKVLGRTVVADFRTRPVADWSAEYHAFLRRTGAGQLSATVLLPRSETIVRQIALPGVATWEPPSPFNWTACTPTVRIRFCRAGALSKTARY
jgi:hypothetical protein